MSRGASHFIVTIIVIGLLGILLETDGAIVPANFTSIHQDVLIDNYIFNKKSVLKSYNEDADLDARSLMRKYGYRGETHKVTTADGYILEMHRITGPTSDSNPKGKKVAFLMHGLLSSSIDWIISGPEKAFAYILADKGYDVWLGNARGNHHSRGHKKYSVLDKKYWMFSWHEVGTEDLPAQIDYIIEETGQEKIFFVGHSQGTTSFFVMASEKPEYNEKIHAMIAFAPVAYVRHMTSPFFQILARFDGVINVLMNMLGRYEFEPTGDFMKKLSAAACDEEVWTQPVCENLVYLISGFGSDQTNRTLLPAILGHIPAGASSRQVIHYAQLIKSNKFRRFDHGFLSNMIKYGRAKPPVYKLNKITAPVIIHYSVNDWLSDVKDVNRLENELGNCHAKVRNPNSKFGHLDYLYGIDAPRILYDKTIAQMKKFWD